MYKWCARIIVITLVFGVCISGCNRDVQMERGKNIHKQLDASGCAETSGYRMAETANGYYVNLGQSLYYSDKTDLSNWVPVCNEPDCNHSQPSCTSKMSYDEFYFHNGRIYTIKHKCDVVPRSTENSQVLVSFAPDGTDLEVEFEIVESNIASGWMDAVLSVEGVYGQYFELLNDGTYKAMVVHADKQGTDVIYEGQTSDDFIVGAQYFWSANEWGCLYGDLVFSSSALAESRNDSPGGLFRIVDGSYEPISHIGDYNTWGACLKDDLLYHFEPNRGFYLTDLATGKSQKRMPAQLSNSEAYHLQSDFIIETNIYFDSRTVKPQLMIFNDGQWEDVTLPENAEDLLSGSFIPLALTTEHIFFHAFGNDGSYLYAVDYAGPKPELTLCAAFSNLFSY